MESILIIYKNKKKVLIVKEVFENWFNNTFLLKIEDTIKKESIIKLVNCPWYTTMCIISSEKGYIKNVFL